MVRQCTPASPACHAGGRDAQPDARGGWLPGSGSQGRWWPKPRVTPRSAPPIDTPWLSAASTSTRRPHGPDRLVPSDTADDAPESPWFSSIDIWHTTCSSSRFHARIPATSFRTPRDTANQRSRVRPTEESTRPAPASPPSRTIPGRRGEGLSLRGACRGRCRSWPTVHAAL